MRNEIRLDASPRALARAEGTVYLIIIILGIFVELFARGRIIVAFFALVAGPGFIGEATFCLWLLIRGLNVEKWNEAVERRSCHV